MCSKCQDVLIGFSIPHTPTTCPLVHSSYCSLCCSYGHLTEDCPDDGVLENRIVQYVEQLVPHSLLKKYNVSTATPVGSYMDEGKPRHEAVLEIEDTDKAIRAVIIANHMNPSGKMKENRRILKQLADEQHRKLVYIAPK